MDQSNNVHLRWSKHQATLVSVFDALLDNEKLTDCTISAEGRHLRAHKIILSACSPYFEELFTDNHEKHPIIILHDVKYKILKDLMDFMYRGEMEVPEEELNGVLKLSESLQLRGLSGSGCVDNVGIRKGSGRNASPLPLETLPSPPASVSCFTTGQNQEEGKGHSGRRYSPAASFQGENSMKSVPNNTESINQSGPEQGAGHNAFEEVITRDFDSSHKFQSQRQVVSTSCNSAGSSVQPLKTHTTIPMSSYSPTLHQSVCSELNSSSGEVVCSEAERNLIPDTLFSLRKSANMSAHRQEVPLETKSEILESSMEIVEDLTVDDDDDNYTADGNFRDDCNIVEVVTGEKKRVNEGLKSEEVFHVHGSKNQHSPSGHDFFNNMTLRASQTVLHNRFSCKTCGNSYSHPSGLSRHKKVHCGNKEPQFQCPHCSYRCARSDNLKAHIIRHSLSQQKYALFEGDV